MYYETILQRVPRLSKVVLYAGVALNPIRLFPRGLRKITPIKVIRGKVAYEIRACNDDIPYMSTYDPWVLVTRTAYGWMCPWKCLMLFAPIDETIH